MKKILYIVATPIGNLNDFSQRALDTLKNVDFILAEDTRHSQKLLNHFGNLKLITLFSLVSIASLVGVVLARKRSIPNIEKLILKLLTQNGRDTIKGTEKK